MKDLKRKLEIIESVRIIDNNHLIKDLYKQEELKIITMIYRDKIDEQYLSKDLTEDKTWLTYRNLIHIEIYENGEVTVELWNGCNVTGEPKNIRWEAKFSGFKSLNRIKEDIDYQFNKYCLNQYDLEEEMKKLSRINAIKKKLLNETN